MNLIKKLTQTIRVRCNCWANCGAVKCYHYEIHIPRDNCILLNPVKYCRIVNGFVHDVPMSELEEIYECDPNLAFKAQQESKLKSTVRDGITYGFLDRHQTSKYYDEEDHDR